MAYLRQLRPCQRCGKPATVELMSSRDVPYGKFCKECGWQAFKELARKELERKP